MKKVFVLLPDGVGLRNFAYTHFVDEAKNNNIQIVFWNNTTFDLKSLGYESIQVPKNKFHPLSDFLKRAKIELLLKHFSRRYKDEVYLSYMFKNKPSNLKTSVKAILFGFIKFLLTFKDPLKIQTLLNFFESRTSFYNACMQQLIAEKPDFVFSTNQRALSSLAPILAAKSLGISTGAFIFSWDNLPKATMVVDADFYFVWSEYMKDELIKYYSISERRIKITGTPQFEPYFEKDNIIPKKEFYKGYQLDPTVKYVCFSGDDVTTSPFDPYYLRDLAKTIKKFNETSPVKYGIIFRRCPVDKSDRYNKVLDQYKEIIISIDPDWKALGGAWNQVMAMPFDIKLLVSTVYYSECVFNVGSSMVFDFANFNKPCYYLNYEVSENTDLKWSIQKIYKYVHFRSMPDKYSVAWVNNTLDFLKILKSLENQSDFPVSENTPKWYSTVVMHPVQIASKRIVDTIDDLIS